MKIALLVVVVAVATYFFGYQFKACICLRVDSFVGFYRVAYKLRLILYLNMKYASQSSM